MKRLVLLCSWNEFIVFLFISKIKYAHIFKQLILSTEEIAMLTHSKPGSCLELILNNGEVLYAVIDSENDYPPPSPKMMQVCLISHHAYYISH